MVLLLQKIYSTSNHDLYNTIIGSGISFEGAVGMAGAMDFAHGVMIMTPAQASHYVEHYAWRPNAQTYAVSNSAMLTEGDD